MKVIHKKALDEDITIEEAKQFECCKDLSDEEISELLETIRTFTEIAYYTYARNKREQDNDGGDTSYNIAS